MLILGILHAIAFMVIKVLESVLFLKSLPFYFKKPIKCPSIQDKILLCSGVALAEKIRNREIKCETVIQTYISRILAVNPILNAVVENCFSEAMQNARSVDTMLENSTLTTQELKQKYPLLGLPITIKGSIAVKSLDHSSGCVVFNGRKALRDARAVQLIREAGGIILLVSNTPELCTSFETFNNMTGRTNNPYDTRRTPGGSSGGEAALLSSGASLMGLGSDILGSIRLPAHYCGIWGHKPSPGSISTDGHFPDSKDRDLWEHLFTLGPLCRYVSDLRLVYGVITEKPLELHKKVSLKNLKFYIMENDGGSILTNPVEDDIITAMRRFKHHLEVKYGVQVKQVKIKGFNYAEIVHLTVMGMQAVDSPFDKNTKGPYYELLQFILGQSQITITPILYGIINGVLEKLPSSVQLWLDNQLAYAKEQFLETIGPDGVLLYPSHPRAAHIHGQMMGRYLDFHYTALFNGLGVPATSCPLGLNSKGLPIGMQVVAAPNNDRFTLEVAEEVAEVFGGWTQPL